ncbi:MAG: GntR family transcriptional regulator [Rubrimonas sp.]|uniref:GntR family transcriptional regulator n=1 Tax=Rubrimonas sp. TaxID=2036015 RepID=UPI002FDCDD82
MTRAAADFAQESPPGHVALAEKVADQLRDMVVRGALAPGQRIVERRLCAELDVSRTPMREALKLLRQDGLVEISRNRGARVTAYDGRAAIDLFDAIGALEAAAAERMARNLDADLLARFEVLHAQMLAEYDAARLDDYFDVNSAIHDLIVEGCGNPVLAESRRRLMLLARRGRYMAIMNAARWRQAVAEHEALMRAFRARDAAAAHAVWRAHLAATGHSVAEALAGGDACATTG